MRIMTLKRPSEFKRVRGGARVAGDLFILEGRRRTESPAAEAGSPAVPRFGFTITRKVGTAVVRNRIRRRLKEALRSLEAGAAEPDFDYVLVASRAAHDYPFAGLTQALREALLKLRQRAVARLKRNDRASGGTDAGGSRPAASTAASRGPEARPDETPSEPSVSEQASEAKKSGAGRRQRR